MVELGAGVCRAIGLPKSLGQVFGALYMSDRPLTLDDLVGLLSISKGSASNSVRRLIGWGAVKQVWIPGERRDHYEAVGEFNSFVNGFLDEFLAPRLHVVSQKLEDAQLALDADRAEARIKDDDFARMESRIVQLKRIRRRIERLSPLLRRIL